MSENMFSSQAMNNCLIIVTISLAFSLSFAKADETKTAYEVLQEYDFPVGLLPTSVTGYEIDYTSGKFKVYLDGTCSYKVEGYELKYKSTISGVIEKDKIKKLKGVSVKVLILWLDIGEITRKGNELEFSVGIASAKFELDGFDESPQCGCGFDCVNFNRFVSSQ